jgi:hypothetical protein
LINRPRGCFNFLAGYIFLGEDEIVGRIVLFFRIIVKQKFLKLLFNFQLLIQINI